MAIKTFSNQTMGIDRKKDTVLLVGKVHFTIRTSVLFNPKYDPEATDPAANKALEPVPALLAVAPKNSQLVGMLAIPTDVCFKYKKCYFDSDEEENKRVASYYDKFEKMARADMIKLIYNSKWLETHKTVKENIKGSTMNNLCVKMPYYASVYVADAEAHSFSRDEMYNPFHAFTLNPRWTSERPTES